MKLLVAGLVLCSLKVCAAEVTFRLNMNGVDGFTTPEVNGTFNGWCGTCSTMSDTDGDGIWERTIILAPGVYEYKYSFDNWTGQENLVSSGCATPSFNRSLVVQGDVALPVVCWGMCSDCLAPNEDAWSLVWSEEFLGNTINTDIWTHELGDHGWGNNEWQNYTAGIENSFVSAGTLKITARYHGGNDYTSARLITNNKFEFQYGKIEGRIKVPTGQGLWPAFWMLGANFESVGWPQCGEIDIMEHVNEEYVTHCAIHWEDNGHTYETSNVPYEKNEFHRYGAIWDENSVTYTLNDHPFFHQSFDTDNNTAQIFQKPFFILLNVAVGGNWPGYPDGTAEFPAVMEVDYIRIYERNTSATDYEAALVPVRLHPIPCSHTLHVEFTRTQRVDKVVVYGSTGAVLGTYPNPPESLSIDMGKWSPGTYIVQIWLNNGEVQTHRVVKI